MAVGLNELEPNVEHQLQCRQSKPLKCISEIFFNAGGDDCPIA